MARSQPAITLSVRISPKTRYQLDQLSDATGRTKSFLAAEAIESYLDLQAWQVKAISASIERADTGRAKFIDHSQVADWLNSWGSESEKEPPK
jgi:RHH-type transcriptional regulator, rel operon repressor / antitoxin RelB